MDRTALALLDRPVHAHCLITDCRIPLFILMKSLFEDSFKVQVVKSGQFDKGRLSSSSQESQRKK